MNIETGDVLADIADERRRQDNKWGEQNHPDGTGPTWPVIGFGAHFCGDAADISRRQCQSAAHHGSVTWHHIMGEEIAEAFAEDDPAKLRAELVQVAAVAVAWIEAIDPADSMSHYPLLIPFLDLARHMIAAALAASIPRAS